MVNSLLPSENVFISPFSIAAVLSMAHVGSRGNTASQLKTVLHLTNYNDNKINGVIGNLCRSVKVIFTIFSNCVIV